MPISAVGNKTPGHKTPDHKRPGEYSPRLARGFTLLELMVVVAIIALASAGVALALRDPSQALLEREAVRLAALLESARAQSRASGAVVTWQAQQDGFRFTGLPENDTPKTWLDTNTFAESATLVLGPEPMIAAQSVLLKTQLNAQLQVRLASDGLGPFGVQTGIQTDTVTATTP